MSTNPMRIIFVHVLHEFKIMSSSSLDTGYMSSNEFGARDILMKFIEIF